MNTKGHRRCCPACGHHFVPWNVWRISIYSSIRCPKCGARLTRRRDLQFFALPFVIVCVFATGLLLGFSPRAFLAYALLVLVLIAWPLDAFTVRLVQQGKWRGWWRGYGT
jgi:DNA-directed RNA polymerase subunit RPC12/RpoP